MSTILCYHKTMARVFIWATADALQPHDYSGDYKTAFTKRSGNTGNLLFMFALQKYLTIPENKVEISSSIEDYEYINSNFDMLIYPCANLLRAGCKDELAWRGKLFSKIKIPIYVIGMGGQTKTVDDFTGLNKFSAEASKFIESVYSSGGAFALRGEHTAELFKKLGYSDYRVTGCPSLYISGREHRISNKKVSHAEFNLTMNGDNFLFDKELARIFETYPKSVFIEQVRFYKFLCCLKKIDLRTVLKFNFRYNKTIKNLIINDRIKCFADVPVWVHYIKTGGFNFTLGSRFHGCVASILAGVPAFLNTVDSRTTELADFFNIPYSYEAPKDPYEAYLNTDYTKFNEGFAARFDNFENFFIENKIPANINNNEYFNQKVNKVPYNYTPVPNEILVNYLTNKIRCLNIKLWGFTF